MQQVQTENQLSEVTETALIQILTDSKLELTATEEIKQSYLPFFNQLAEIKEAAKKINFENPTELDEQIARKLRLQTAKIRTSSEDVKDSRKKGYLLRGNLEQASWNLIKSGCLLDEEIFREVEERRARIEKLAKEKLKVERSEMLLPYGVDVTYIDLANMPEDGFQKLFADSKKGYEDRVEAERKAREAFEAIAKANELHQKRKSLLLPYWFYVPADKRDMDFSTLTENEFVERFDYSKKQKDEFDKRQAEIATENERLKGEADKKRKELEDALLLTEKIKKQAGDKANKAKADADKLLKEQKEKADKLAKEIQDKKDDEARELKLKQDAEKKALKAPDRQKLIQLSEAILTIKMPELKSDEAKEILANVVILLNKTRTFIAEKVTTL